MDLRKYRISRRCCRNCCTAWKNCTSSTPCWAIAAAAWASPIPEITEMQARAIFEAVVQVAKKGVKVIPEVMIPLIGGVKELKNQKEIVVRVADEVLAKAGMKDQHYMVGTMIEIPRAALTADAVATEARVLQLRHQRPDPDHHGPLARRLYEVPEGLRRRTRSSPTIRSPFSIRKASASW